MPLSCGTRAITIQPAELSLANDAIFRNNTKAVQALMYWNFNPINPEQRMDNRSYFKNCTFELTEDYHAEEKFYKHVDLFDVFGIDFKVCNFSLDPKAENVSYLQSWHCCL
jgi:hypothetical protein